jgi:hypothetical protein
MDVASEWMLLLFLMLLGPQAFTTKSETLAKGRSRASTKLLETWSKGDEIVSAKSETWATASEGLYKIGIVKFRLKGRIFGGLMGIDGPVGKGLCFV